MKNISPAEFARHHALGADESRTYLLRLIKNDPLDSLISQAQYFLSISKIHLRVALSTFFVLLILTSISMSTYLLFPDLLERMPKAILIAYLILSTFMVYEVRSSFTKYKSCMRISKILPSLTTELKN